MVIDTDICVIGGGSGGLSVAAGAVQMGARVVLVEPGPMGGDCLNFGCVPSKALISAAKTAHQMRHCQHLGVQAAKVTVDMAGVARHVQSVIDAIAPHDSVERFESLGVKVIQQKGQFIAPDKVKAGDEVITAKYFVLATGSTAFIPPLSGLEQTPYLTNHSIFQQATPMEHLLVLGGGPIGLELAQAHRRLGARVSVFEMMRCMAKDDAECAKVVVDQLRHEGVEIYQGYQAKSVQKYGDVIRLSIARLDDAKTEQVIEGSHLLVATGRRAMTDGLGLEAAGIAYSPRGIEVNASLRTSNRRVFAIGDVIGHYQFTHTAGYHAGVVIRQMLLRLPVKAKNHAMPWVTYTDPELAHVGESEHEAVQRLGRDRIRVVSWSFADNDRAQTEAKTQGKIKVVTDRRGRVLGVDIVGQHAGELILPWQKMVAKRQKISQMAGVIAPYPTRSEISKRIAGQYFTPMLYGTRMHTIVRLLLRLPS